MERYPIDNSALIHLAVHSRYHSNVFRLEVHLKSALRPLRLRRAVNAAAHRLPMLAAGIRKQKNTFVVVPGAVPEMRMDTQPLARMSEAEIRDCAMRVLYGRRHIAVEFFHALTDGTGGMKFAKVLLAEYLGIPAETVPLAEGWEDSYKRYAQGRPTAMPGGASYLLPSAPQEGEICKTILTLPLEQAKRRVHAEGTTLTAFFTALFAQTAMELQQEEKQYAGSLLPVRIMVPVDLRRRFASATLRNFSLYALPVLPPEAAGAPFSEIVGRMEAQLRAQNAPSRLQDAITTNVNLEQKTAALPLWLKCAVLKAGFEICGGRSSCITVSNLGAADFPEELSREIERVDFMLTPRAHSPYNCGIVSAGDTLSLTITRRGADRGVEKRFVSHLIRQGLAPHAVEEEAPAAVG